MSSNKGKARATSTSPTQAQDGPAGKPAKVGDGGVKLPNDTEKVDEKNPQGAVNTNGIAPANGVTAPEMETSEGPSTNGHVKQPCTIIATVNGNSSNENAAQSSHSAKLSVNAITFKPKPSPMSYLNVDSVADDSKSNDTGPLIVSSDVVAKTNHNNVKRQATQEPIGTRGENFSPTRKVFFTTDVGPDVISPGGHYIQIMNVHSRELESLLKALNENHDWTVKLRGFYCPPKQNSTFHDVFCAFDDVRDAEASFQEVNVINTKVNIRYVAHEEYSKAQALGYGEGKETFFYDGSVLFTAHFGGLTSEMTAQNLFAEVHELAQQCGEVLAFVENECGGGVWQFRAEYYKISVAKNVVGTITKTNPKHLGKWTIYAEEHPERPAHMIAVEGIYNIENDAHCMSTPQKSGLVPGMINTSPTGRTAWRYNENGERVPVAAPKQLPKTITNTGPFSQHRTMSDPFPETPLNGQMAVDDRIYANSWSAPSGHTYSQEEFGYANTPSTDMFGTPTSVDVEKIVNGQDVRTTVMLRNLPNNMTFHQLKYILDAVCFGKYDFSYLRVDFGNNMNVGYGFVNFTDPMYIVDFVKKYVGRPWIQARYTNRKRGPRIADVSYATVQGYDCLVEKFRNSSVMDEYPDYRPKLWWTFETAANRNLVGTEVNFPKPNNPSKHQRSRDNATQVGLYTSGNRRNRNQNGNRNRRSQYDRGTSAQMREDASYNQQFIHMSPLQGGYGYAGSNYMLGGPQMAVAPPPRFPIMQAPGINGYGLANGLGGLPPYGHSSIQFIDPFVNGGYPIGHQAQGIAPMNGRFVGQPEPPTSGRRFYQSGVDCDRIPKAIAEEDGYVDDEASYPNGQIGNGFVRTFGSQH